MYFVFSTNKYHQIRKASADFPLEKHDLKVTCEEESYQRLSFNACPDAAWKLNPEIYKSVSAQAQKLAAHLDAQLGQNLTKEAILARIGAEPEKGSSEGSTDLMDKLINNL